MNKREADTIADYVTYYQLDKMFDSARNNITDWKNVSNVNKNMTKGAVWNILWQSFEMMSSGQLRRASIRNMVWEFGDYLPNNLKPKKKIKKTKTIDNLYHEKPIFN